MTKKQMRMESRFADTTANLTFLPRFNIAPTQLAAVLRVSDGKLVQQNLSWGFRPVWSKAPIINAKSETLLEKSTFKKAAETQRCLVPADGFYEWKMDGIKKRPMRIHLQSNEPFCFAGLWRDAPDAPGSFLILTTAANDFMQSIHSRMPVILKRADYDAWLSPTDDGFRPLLQVPCGLELTAVEVSSRVNNVRNEDEGCLLPPERELF